MVTNLTKPKKMKKGSTERQTRTKKRQSRIKLLQFHSSTRYSFKTLFAFNYPSVEVYINNQQIYKPKGLYANKSYTFDNLKGAISENKGVLHCELYENEECPDNIMLCTRPCLNPFPQGKLRYSVHPMISCRTANWVLTF